MFHGSMIPVLYGSMVHVLPAYLLSAHAIDVMDVTDRTRIRVSVRGRKRREGKGREGKSIAYRMEWPVKYYNGVAGQLL